MKGHYFFISAMDDLIQATTSMLPLPPGWVWSTLEQIGEVITGTTPPKANPANYGNTTPFIKPPDLANRTVTKASEYLSEEGRKSARLAPIDSVLVSCIGILGKTGLTAQESAFNQQINAIVCHSVIEPRYLFYYCQSTFVKEWLESHASATTVTIINKGKFQQLPVPIPLLTEQQQIIEVIETQFTRLDAAGAALKRVQANLRRYRAAVLKEACEGRLVPTEAELAQGEGRTYEPAAEIIRKTPSPPRPNRWNSRSKDVIPGHAALAVGNPDSVLPEGWVWTPLVEIARMESGHTPSREHPEWWGGDIPWIGIADAREFDGKTILQTFQHTNEQGIANSAARILPGGTVCVSRTASVGYVVTMGRPMATSQDFVNWTPTAAVTSDWLRIVFSADREALRRFGKGSVHKTIYFPEWLSVHIALPPVSEQKRIAQNVDSLLSQNLQLERYIDASLLRSQRLRQSILQRAFSGPMVSLPDSNEWAGRLAPDSSKPEDTQQLKLL